MDAITKEFISQNIYRIEKNTPRIRECLNQLTEEQVWQRPNESSNSIGNLLLHLRGNIYQYIITTLGQATDIRERDKEFMASPNISSKELFNQLSFTVSEAIKIIREIDEERLLKVYPVQDTRLTGIGIIIHVTEHYSYHTGQIAFYTKQLINKDLGFYAGRQLDKKN